MAISQALIPSISKSYAEGNKKYVTHKIKQGIILSLCVGIPMTIFLVIKPTFLLEFLYHTKEGSLYLQVLAPIFLVQYIQSPMSSSLQAIGKATVSMKATLLGTTIRTLCLLIFLNFKIGLWPFVIAISASIILTSLYEAKSLKKLLD
jgi:stage V sporulation protein B